MKKTKPRKITKREMPGTPAQPKKEIQPVQPKQEVAAEPEFIGTFREVLKQSGAIGHITFLVLPEKTNTTKGGKLFMWKGGKVTPENQAEVIRLIKTLKIKRIV